MNPYLKAKRAKYDELRKSVEGLQNRAVSDKRDLTTQESELVTGQGVEMGVLLAEIETLTEIEVRNAQHAKFADDVRAATRAAAGTADAKAEGDGTGDEGDGAPTDGGDVKVGGATTTDRDPGHYTRSSKRSFFADLVNAGANGDREAQRRLGQNTAYTMRAAGLTTGANGPGVVPPKWLTEEFAEIARQGRALANVVRNIPLGDDPRPLTLPKQTAGTDAVVLPQSLENDAVSETDSWDSDTDVVTPVATSGAQKVSRQMLDMASPAIDSLIYSDLIAAYNLKVEKKVAAAMTAAAVAGTALSGLEDPAVTDVNHYSRTTVRAATAVRQARKLGANIVALSIGRHGEFIDLRDTTGRPLVPDETVGGLMNVLGVGSVNVDGRYRMLGMIATEGMLSDDQFIVARSADTLLFESNMLRFRYEEIYGPQAIKLGIWAYTATLVRYGTASVKAINITDES